MAKAESEDYPGQMFRTSLCRELRRITGLRPTELRKMIAHESYWMYQVWARLPAAN